MTDYNLIVLVGRLMADPELQYTEAEGTPFTTLELEIRRVTTQLDGSSEEAVTHVDVVVWKHQAELCCQFTRKGTSLLVSGFLEQLRWTDKEGKKRGKLRVRAQRIQFLEQKPAAPTVV